ncbi:Protein of unknown function [Pyronema omphalodes CBS 100304]|uniref:Uncharacterized protein n=1 Tax=Pyronema omphalodes (strain CBS 100304) TaxID=1076935 RepID=U4LQ46_PYROM|nr:Protein of unknown function [Pyronema omphalodes CBS 100304]
MNIEQFFIAVSKVTLH